MNETIENQYVHFIESCINIEQIENLEEKIERNYGVISEKLKEVFQEQKEKLQSLFI